MKNALRSLWREPRAPDNPGILWWDRWLVVAVVITAILEGLLRSDVVLPALAIALAAVVSLTLLWRRTHPFGMVVITFSAVTVMNAVVLGRGDYSFGLYTMAVILLIPYALVRWGSGREIVVGLGIIVIAYGTGIAADYTTFGEAIAAFVFAMSPALIGAVVRYREYAMSRDRDQAVLREREQIARELHDTVAHHVSAIAIRAQAGQVQAATDPDAPLAALGVIEAEASKTLTEMRAMVGALRQGEEPELVPRAGVTDIERLGHDVDGHHVTVEVSGDFDDVAPAVDAALYRVAQESITNAIRHARNATAISVTVTEMGDTVEVSVHDDGETTLAQSNPELGFGLLGMAERAKLLGGEFAAAPDRDGGWTVKAGFPKDGVGR